MRKQFNLQDWLKDKSQRVETRDGRPVRIVCWDRNGDYPIMALATEANGNESYITCLSNGRKTIHDQEFPSDLFIVTPEPELTAWEKAVGRAIAGFQLIPKDKDGMHNRYDVNEFIKKNAAELLAMARKQLQPEIDSEIAKADSIVYDNGVLFGKAEALKDLPSWKKDESFETEGSFMGVKGREFFVVKDGYSISVSELIEKLPGFKEDSHE